MLHLNGSQAGPWRRRVMSRMLMAPLYPDTFLQRMPSLRRTHRLIKRLKRVLACFSPQPQMIRCSPEFVQQRITTDHVNDLRIKKDTEFRNQQTIEDALMGGKDGKIPSTLKSLITLPRSNRLWEDLLPSHQRRYMGVLARNAKGDTNWTDTSLREYQRSKVVAATDPANIPRS